METGYWSALYRRLTASLHAPYICPAVSPRETLNPSELDLAAARPRSARAVGDHDARGGLAPIFTRFFDRLLEGAAFASRSGPPHRCVPHPGGPEPHLGGIAQSASVMQERRSLQDVLGDIARSEERRVGKGGRSW